MSLRWPVAAAGLFGAAGVALMAMAAHRGGGNLGTAAQMLLFHAPALLAIGLIAPRGRMLGFGAILLCAGTLLFAGDLVLRELAGTRAFPMAAPAGGLAMIAGWIAVAAGAFGARNG